MRDLYKSKEHWSQLLIRLMVGAVFLSEGIQKFLFAEALGVGRFEKLGIPIPHLLAPFVGGTEIIFGGLILVGFKTRLSAIPLLTVILVAIATTKFPMLIEKGIWPTLHEGRAGIGISKPLFGAGGESASRVLSWL